MSNDIYRIRKQNIQLDDNIKKLEKSIDKCSSDIPLEMMLTKGHLDLLYYKKNIELNDYNIVNDVIKEIGKRFRKCKCISTEID